MVIGLSGVQFSLQSNDMYTVKYLTCSRKYHVDEQLAGEVVIHRFKMV